MVFSSWDSPTEAPSVRWGRSTAEISFTEIPTKTIPCPLCPLCDFCPQPPRWSHADRPLRGPRRGNACARLEGNIPLNFGEFGLTKDCVILANEFCDEGYKETLLLSNFLSVWALGRGAEAAGESHWVFVSLGKQELGPKLWSPCQHTALVLLLLPNKQPFSNFVLPDSFKQPP